MTTVPNSFSGRALYPFEAETECVVSTTGFSTLAQFFDSMAAGAPVARGGDADCPALFGQQITDRILCIPHAIGSTSAGSTWEYVARNGLAPRAILLSETIDTLTAAGMALADIWAGRPIGVIDRLGAEFLASVQSGMILHAKPDGTVTLKSSPEETNT